MVELIFSTEDGSETIVHAEPGGTVMNAAVDNAVDGIIGDCGGSMTCATCHVFIDDRGGAQLRPMGTVEDEVLEGTVAPRQANSRLSCQIELTEEMTTLRMILPKSQW